MGGSDPKPAGRGGRFIAIAAPLLALALIRTDVVLANDADDSSADATLSGLALGAGRLIPAFDAAETNYTVAVLNEVSSVAVTPTTADPDATVAYLDSGGSQLADADDSTPAFDLDLAVGANKLDVKVTAEDGQTALVYKVTVTRITAFTPPPAVRTVAPDWALIPGDLEPGDPFRLLFVTSTETPLTTIDINDYNRFVQGLAAAGHAHVRTHATHFRALASTAAVAARDNTGTHRERNGDGEPIYWLGGGTRVADDYAGLYDDDWQSESWTTEAGGAGSDSVLYVVTGTKSGGATKRGRALGDLVSSGDRVGGGVLNAGGGSPLYSVDPPGRTAGRIYGLSSVFQVRPRAVGEVAAITAFDASVAEGETAAFSVMLDREASTTVTVDYATSDQSATAELDYSPASGNLTFAAGETVKTVPVSTLEDSSEEGTETFVLTLSGPTGGAVVSDGSAVGTIEDVWEPVVEMEGVVAVSNMDQSWDHAPEVGRESPQGAKSRNQQGAQIFTTGEDSRGYWLSSIQLILKGYEETEARHVQVSLHLAGPATERVGAKVLDFANPTNYGTMYTATLGTFVPADATSATSRVLLPNTDYLVSLRIQNQNTLRWFQVYSTNSEAETGEAGWSIADEGHWKRNGWSWYVREDAVKMAIRVQTPLTAELRNVPSTHDGETPIAFGLHFSEDAAVTEQLLRDAAFDVQGGTVTAVRKLEADSDLAWEITIDPSTLGHMTIALAPKVRCETQGAICTEDGRRLGKRVEATVNGPFPGLPTVAFDDDTVPPAHRGRMYRVGLSFSEELEGIEYVWVRDTLASADGAAVVNVRRTSPPSNVGWELDVVPDSATVDTTVRLAARLELPDGRVLGAGDSATVPSRRALSAADATAAEGGTAAFEVTVDRSAPAPVTVDYATSDGCASSDSDYEAASGTLTFAAGETSKTVSVALLDDEAAEDDETFALRLSRASGNARLADATATGTIEDNEPSGPRTTFDDDTVPSAHGGEMFRVRLSFNEEVEGIGYVWVRDTLASADGATVVNVRRTDPPSNVGWELDVEPDSATADTTVRLASGLDLPDGRTLLSGDEAAVPSRRALSVADARAAEGGTVSFAVTLDRAAPAAVTVDYATSDGSATSGSDYEAASGTLTFAAGETSKTVAVALLDDEADEGDETFTLRLAGASGNARLADATATGTIEDVAGESGPTATFDVDGDTVPEHDGTAFTVGLTFSEEVSMSYVWVRDTVVSAENAEVTRARRRERGSNTGWNLEVEPASTADVRLEVVDGLELADERTLVGGDRVTVRGPTPQDASADGAVVTLVWVSDRDGFGRPGTGDFPVVVNGAPRAVASAALAGRRATLVLVDPVAPGDAVSVSYVGSAMHPLADATGTLRSPPWFDLPAANVTGTGLSASVAVVPAPRAEGDPLAAAPDDAVWLSAPDRGVADLGGLSRLRDLRRLDLSDNAVVDLTPLASLTELHRLDLSGNAVADLGPLAGLVELRRLDLSGNRVTDLAPLAGLGKLEVLVLDGNAVTDLGPLVHLGTLEHLGLSGNRVPEVWALADLWSLRRLDLSGNPVADLSPVGDVAPLVWLALPGDQIGAAAPVLGRLTRLRWVHEARPDP